MKKLAALLLGTSLVVGPAALLAQEKPKEEPKKEETKKKKSKKKKGESKEETKPPAF